MLVHTYGLTEQRGQTMAKVSFSCISRGENKPLAVARFERILNSCTQPSVYLTFPALARGVLANGMVVTVKAKADPGACRLG